jgi:O-antigen ligase
MLARLGDVIYWFACIVAAIILAVGVFDYWFGQGGLLVLISWMALVAIPWLIGSAIRYILSGK